MSRCQQSPAAQAGSISKKPVSFRKGAANTKIWPAIAGERTLPKQLDCGGPANRYINERPKWDVREHAGRKQSYNTLKRLRDEIYYAPVVAYGGREMVSADLRNRNTARRPTECLLRSESGHLSPVMVYRLAAKGFELKDVQEMLSISDLYSTKKILSRIVGKSIRATQRQGSNNPPLHLNSQQSAVAFQYAKVLEHAINVFGTQKLVEDWLGRPCTYRDGDVPLDVIDNSMGFQAVEHYLERIEYGVYQ